MAASVSYFAHLCDGLQVHPPRSTHFPIPNPTSVLFFLALRLLPRTLDAQP